MVFKICRFNSECLRGHLSATANTMQAKIDGKEWVATSMVPPEAAGRIVGYYQDQYIGFP